MRIYKQALQNYSDVSPFPVAWVCFQLGVLWGELAPEPRTACAVLVVRKSARSDYQAIRRRAYIWQKSICLAGEQTTRSSALMPALPSGDPEVRWRLADVMTVQGKDADAQMQAARSRIWIHF